MQKNRRHQIPDFKAIKCTRYDFRQSSAPDPAGGAYSAPPDPPDLAVFKGLSSKGSPRERERRRKRIGEGKGEKRREEGKGREGGRIKV